MILISALLTMGLVWLVDRLWERDARRRHNDVAGYMISVVAVVYAVLLGFVTVTVWENYDKASASVGDEAVLIADIYCDVGVLPQSVAVAVRRDLVSYATAVIGEEWPQQMAGQQLRSTHSALDKVPQHLMDAATTDPTTVVFLREIAGRLNSLHDARRARICLQSSGPVSYLDGCDRREHLHRPLQLVFRLLQPVCTYDDEFGAFGIDRVGIVGDLGVKQSISRRNSNFARSIQTYARIYANQWLKGRALESTRQRRLQSI
jgi:hypothetical protein